MSWKKIKDLVGMVAPTLGSALGGPFGGMAGQFLADQLGVESDKLEDTILNANPDTLLKVKEADQAFKLKMKELDISEEQLHSKDRGSARNLAINTSLIPQAIISAVFIIGFIIVLYMVFKGDVNIEGTMKDAALFLLGILSAGITQIMNFFFGSSSGSKQKTNLMGNK